MAGPKRLGGKARSRRSLGLLLRWGEGRPLGAPKDEGQETQAPPRIKALPGPALPHRVAKNKSNDNFPK